MSDPMVKTWSFMNRVLMKMSMFGGLNLNKPTYICAKMTMRCNSRCVHCNIWKMENNDQELSTEQWLKTLGRLRDWLGRFRMVFTGGEALLREDMPIILAHAVRLGISVELLSNGLMIDEALADRIAASGIDQITISLDGTTPATHDRFRGDGNYHDRTKAAILALISQRKLTANPLRILLKTVISANNLRELVPIARWVQEHGLEVQYQPIEQNYGEKQDPGWYRGSPLWITDLAALKEVLDELCSLAAQGNGIDNTRDDFSRFYDYFEHPEKLMATIQGHDSKNRRGHCLHAVSNFVISSNGDVRMCFMMEPIGNIALQSPKEIWSRRKHCWAGPCDYR